MRVAIVFVYPLGGAGKYYDRAVRFLQTYHDNPPGHDHDTVIVCNGAPASDETQFMFSSLPNVRFLEHGNQGQDIGAFQLASQHAPCDMMVYFGAETYFRKPNWLARMVEVFTKYGQEHLYGSTGNQGDARFNVWAHARTTAFWCSPHMMNAHPMRVTGMGENERYAFEHGQHGLSSWFLEQNKRVWIVGWDCVMPLQMCDSMPGGFHQGGQENILVGDRLTCEPYHYCS